MNGQQANRSDNPLATPGGNPTRPLVEHKNSVVIAVEVDSAGSWLGVYAYRTWTRAVRALEPSLTESGEVLDAEGWDLWTTATGQRYLVSSDEIR